MSVIVVIIAGIIIGFLGKLVAPGDKDNTPWWLTILCGIAGVAVGWFVYGALAGSPKTTGVDWIRWLVSIVLAAIFVMVASTITGRNTKKHILR